jgi:hypothetical protein
MKRIYHPYWEWEDYQNGMWRKCNVVEEKDFLEKAIVFTGDFKLYGEYMIKITLLWPITCQHNLTDNTQNRKAWLGHAACCLAINCPEYITRQAWGYLNNTQQKNANIQAENAIIAWEKKNNFFERITDYAQELFD